MTAERVLKLRLSIIVLATMAFTTGCLESASLVNGQASTSTFSGCLSANGVSNSSVRVEFAFPSEADKVVVYRDGIQIGNSAISSVTSILDNGLMEGVTYQYTCDAFKGATKIAGSNTVSGSPINTNAPIFSGITNVVQANLSSVKVFWNPESSSSAKASYYVVYANTGSTVNWSGTPRARVAATGIFSNTIEGLGDELPYVYGVRACTKDDLCDSNTISKPLTLPDSGAPRTTGVSSLTGRNHTIYITAPWEASQGAVKERRIYVCIGANCTYPATPTKTEVVTDLINPPQELQIESAVDFTTYRIKIIDVDPSGNSNSAVDEITLATGDMTEPVFLGITSLIGISPIDKAVRMGFTASAREGTSDIGAANGIKEYLLYYNSASFGSTPANACSKVVPDSVISASAYAGGGAVTYDVTNLQARTNYSFCLRARDTAGNVSSTNAPWTITTGDLTPPDFIGLQSLVFRTTEKDLKLSWNAPTSNDMSGYTIRIWKNHANPTDVGAQLTTLTATVSQSTGRTISQTEYPLNDYDVVYASVDACDNTSSLGLGLPNNCTTFYSTPALAKSVNIPDIRPPQGFLSGILAAGAGQTESLVEGQAKVRWHIPSSPYPADYAGFNIYSVDPASATGAKTLLKSCGCAVAGSCSTVTPESANPDLVCTVTNLNPYRLYRLHVVAYDAMGNESTDLSPLSSYSDLRIKDTTAPANGNYASNLTISGIDFSWSAATDNQYSVGNDVTYKLYRKITSTFANPNAPDVDGSLVYSGTLRSFVENTLSVGGTYYYGICAYDAAGNKACDGGNIKMLSVTDVTPPLIYSFTSAKTADSRGLLKKWSLTWSADDPGGTTSTNLRVKIYQKYSDVDSTVTATSSDTQIFNGYANSTTLADVTGPTGVNVWINYLMVVEDSENNRTTSSMTVYSANKLSFKSIKNSVGLLAGGTLVVIEGSGFSKGTENNYSLDTAVTFSGSPCTNLKVYSDEYMSCVTPSKSSAGSVDLRLTNPEGTILNAPGAFVYSSAVTDACDIFDANGGVSTSYANAPANGGTATGTSISQAYLICNTTQLMLALNTNTSSRYYVLGRNLDLGAFSTLNSTIFSGTMTGNGYSLVNFTRPSTSITSLGAIGVGTATFDTIKLLGFKLTSSATSTTAGTGTCGLFGQAVNTGSLKKTSNLVFVLKGVTIVADIDCSSGDGFRVGTISGDIGYVTATGTINIIEGSDGSRSKIISTLKAKASSDGGSLNTSGAVGGLIGYAIGTGTQVIVRNTDVKTHVTVLGNTSNVIRVGGMVGFTTTGSTTHNISLSSAELNIVKQTAGSGTVRFGGLVGCTPGGLTTIDQTKTKITLVNNLTGTVGGFFASGACDTSSTGVQIADSYTSGSYTGATTGNNNFGSTLTPSSASAVFSTQRIFSAIHFTPAGSMALSTQYRNFVPDISLNPTVVSSGVLYRAESFPYGGVSAGLMDASAITDDEMKVQTSGNVFELNNFDFTSGSAKWKWCHDGEYPRLSFEDCNEVQ